MRAVPGTPANTTEKNSNSNSTQQPATAAQWLQSASSRSRPRLHPTHPISSSHPVCFDWFVELPPAASDAIKAKSCLLVTRQCWYMRREESVPGHQQDVRLEHPNNAATKQTQQLGTNQHALSDLTGLSTRLSTQPTTNLHSLATALSGSRRWKWKASLASAWRVLPGLRFFSCRFSPVKSSRIQEIRLDCDADAAMQCNGMQHVRSDQIRS